MVTKRGGERKRGWRKTFFLLLLFQIKKHKGNQ